MMEHLFPNVYWPEIWQGTLDTLGMSAGSLPPTILFGIPLGVLLYLTGPRQLLESHRFYQPLSICVNILRSIPFVILIILLANQEVTQAIVGTKIGVLGAIPPLAIAAIPFLGRLVETALREVNRGIIEAALSMGANPRQVVTRFVLPEATAAIIAAIVITAITLISYTAMSGIIGGGGLGDLAIRYGYNRNQPDVTWVTVTILVVLIQALQSLGDFLVARFTHK